MVLFGESGTNPALMAFTIGGVMAFLALARALFPYTPPGNLTDDELALLAHRTRNYNTSAAVFGVGAAFGVGFGFWAGCRAIAALWDRAMPGHVFLYRMYGGETPNTMWAIPAFFLGLFGAYWGHVLAIRLMFGVDGLFAWQIVTNRKAGYDSHWVTKAMSVLCVAGSLVWAPLFLDYYARVEEDRFVYNELLGFGEKSHPYADVKMIARTTHVRAPSGAEPMRSRLHVYFTDGTVWTAEPAEQYQPLVAFLTQKTGRQLVTARFTWDLPDK
jgi:hypothetical protein